MLWIKHIRLILIGSLFALLLNTEELQGQTYHGLRVIGKDICDARGNKIILRGVNAMFIFSPDKDGTSTYPEISKTGANVTRIFWMTSSPAHEADKNISSCINHGMIPIWALWDATGKWGYDLQKCVDYWCEPSTLEIIKKYEDYLILNIANEPGEKAMENFASTYKKAITQLRNAGIKVPLMIDADGWGRNESSVLNYGRELLDADAQHNIIFSWHPWNVNYNIEPVFKKAYESNLPFVVGEFAKYSVACSCCIAYTDILKYAQKYEIGWLAWSWGVVSNGDCAKMDMTNPVNPVFESLHGWGLEVAVTHKYSIKNTSIRMEALRKNYE